MSDRRTGKSPAVRRLAAALLVLALTGPAGADEASLRDPMRPYQPSRSAEPRDDAPAPFHLNAVLISPGRRVAVINGEIRREGETVGGAIVARIEPRRVSLNRRGELIVLRLAAPADGLRIRSGDGSR